MILASIDIGSNAARLLFVNVYEGKDGPMFKKADLVRVPIRLGDDAFTHKKISQPKIDKLLLVMKSFRSLIDFYEVRGFRACATSALRDATNAPEVVALIKKETGIAVEVVDGQTEAQIIYANHAAEDLDKNNDYLYIDVGGGSTELTLFSKDVIVASRSFNIGTIRVLNNLVPETRWDELKTFVRETLRDRKRPLVAIGSGGNINKLFKMSRKKQSKPLSYEKLKQLYEFLDATPLEKRVKELGLNPDRADVIVPAAKIFLTVMKLAAIDKVHVPQIGMADGLIHLLYEEQKKLGGSAPSPRA